MTPFADKFLPLGLKRPLQHPSYPAKTETKISKGATSQALGSLLKMQLFAVWDPNGLDLDEVSETEQHRLLGPQENEKDLRFYPL